MQLVQNRTRFELSQTKPVFCYQRSRLLFHSIQLRDQQHHWPHAMLIRFESFVEISPGMSPASDLNQSPRRVLEKGVIPAIGVGLQVTAISSEEFFRSRA